MPGMWSELERVFRQDNVVIGWLPSNGSLSSVKIFPPQDKTASFFVGDAAGRQYAGHRNDFSSTDRKWALNIGIPFFTPEVCIDASFNAFQPIFFSGVFPKSSTSYILLATGIPYLFPSRPFVHHRSAVPRILIYLYQVPLVTPTSSPMLPSPPRQELVIFVGYPCLGKTSFYRRYFQSPGYVHVNQDTLKTRDKCVKAAREVLRRGESCVIGKASVVYALQDWDKPSDNTNRDASTRKYYIDVAKEHGISTRCAVHTLFMHYLFSRLLQVFSIYRID